MKKKKLLWTAAICFSRSKFKELEKYFFITLAPKANKINTVKLLKSDNYDVWIVDTCPKFYVDETILKHCKSLRQIGSPATGSTHVDISYIKKSGIKYISIKYRKVINNIFSSSEHAFGLLLSSIRNIRPGINYALNGKWRGQEEDLRTSEIYGKNYGLVGFGRIGKNLARYGLSFGMNVGFFDPFVSSKSKKIKQFKTLHQLYNWAHFISIQVHLNESTKGLISNKILSQKNSKKILINISRGEIVDEKSIIKNIKNNNILKYATDVVSNEQDPERLKNNPLIKFAKKSNNIIITPHIGGLSYDSELKAAKDIFKQLIKTK